MAKILLVDDEMAVRKSLSWALKKEGHQVMCFEDFSGAKIAIDHNDYDIYIIDIFLPDRNGLDLIKFIRKRGKQGIIIIISGYPNVPMLIDLMRLEAYDYIKKPFSIGYLKSVIDMILRIQDEMFGYDIADNYVGSKSE